MRSAPGGGQRDLTSGGSVTPEIDMPQTLVLPDSIVGCADALRRVFACSCPDGDSDATRVHLDDELDSTTVPQLMRTLSAPKVQPPAPALLLLPEEDLAS